ncbi:MAG: hypothetical protein U0441_09585 [Polyangiaceae bacterium]
MKKLALLALATASLALVPACTAESSDSDPADETVGESQSALVVNGTGWAYVLSSGAIGGSYAYNSSGGSITTAKLTTGQYSVDFNGIPYVSPSNAQAVAYGSNAQCKLFTTPTGNGLKTSVYVNCYSPAGAFVDSAFTVTLDSRSGNDTAPYRGAFLSTGGGTSPTALQSWNSSGSTNTIVWNAATNMFNVTLPGLSLENAAVHVTAIGATNNRCKINGWSLGVVRVQCMTPGGALTSSTGFSLTYQERSILPVKAGAHTWVTGGAPQASYSGGYGYFTCFVPTYSAATVGQSLKVTMTQINGTPNSGPAIVPMVTAYGNSADYCNLAVWGSTGNDGNAQVTCYTNSGVAVTAGSSPFTLTISSREAPGPC